MSSAASSNEKSLDLPAALPSPPNLQPDMAVFLDLDGTLVPFASLPYKVRAAPYLPQLLLRVRSSLRGALGIISGRSIREVDRIIEWTVQAVAGIHGLERRDAAGMLVLDADDKVGLLTAVREVLAQFQQDHKNVFVEDKGASLAIHFRNAVCEEDACRKMAADLVRQASGALSIVNGHSVVEIRPIGPDKSGALQAFLQEVPFRDKIPVFVGDDLTDEVAFEEVRRREGIGVIVGGPRPTAARFALGSVRAVHEWLNTISDRRTV